MQFSNPKLLTSEVHHDISLGPQPDTTEEQKAPGGYQEVGTSHEGKSSDKFRVQKYTKKVVLTTW
jgi:hypothetical protein